ncbi:MAG: hypothetical protein AUK47_07055 [Deltaproteobacteria bacterium CG2_30_63_29]|nr:MAG: hypothetical protein AUK47_07055 [Deltaproteobacteria bacterium CG2_30_63_29]PIV74899.1 MAG: hypothetical protein COW55_07730 [Rhodobacteraceae bacterium CG17_big_fil_post_rev_8_21_14_2_50_65_11]PJB36698.1 MAG: hypothetical protein CO108_22765 [Deltaproteobacteria bacterium CG_4_9_14_3_um_filter_63_12]
MYKGEEKNPVTLLIISLICFLFVIVWMFQTADELNKALNREEFNPMIVLISSLICFPALYFWGYKMTQVLPELQQSRGLPPSDNSMLIFILFIVYAPVGLFMYQQELNKVWQATPAY